MKILTVTTSYPRRVDDMAGRFIESACLALAARGHAITVLCPHETGLPLSETRGGITVRRFRYAPDALEKVAYGNGIPDNLRNSWRAWLALPSFLLALRGAVKNECAAHDVIHAHWAPCGLAAAQGKTPLAVSLRGSDLADNFVYRKILQSACRRADAVICVSAEIREKILAAGYAKEALAIPNGIDLPDAPTDKDELKKQLGIPENCFCVLAVGRLAAVKNYATLLRGFSLLRKDCVDPRLIILGEGCEREKLKRLAAELGLGNSVIFAGEVPFEKVKSYLGATDVFAISSLREGRSNALLEAIAAGLPVVASDADGVGAIVRAAGCGELFPVGDAQACGKALQKIVDDEKLRSEYAANSRRYAQAELFSWEKHAELLEQALDGISSKRHSCENRNPA
jgi:glycosyltransferase involved in cell wall biosynthesis